MLQLRKTVEPYTARRPHALQLPKLPVLVKFHAPPGGLQQKSTPMLALSVSLHRTSRRCPLHLTYRHSSTWSILRGAVYMSKPSSSAHSNRNSHTNQDRSVSTLSASSAILGVLSIFLGFLTGIPAIIVGMKAKRKQHSRYVSTSGATLGVTLGAVFTALSLLGVAWAVGNADTFFTEPGQVSHGVAVSNQHGTATVPVRVTNPSSNRKSCEFSVVVSVVPASGGSAVEETKVKSTSIPPGGQETLSVVLPSMPPPGSTITTSVPDC